MHVPGIRLVEEFSSSFEDPIAGFAPLRVGAAATLYFSSQSGNGPGGEAFT